MNARILCAYDGSATAEKAFDYALALAAAFGGRLSVLAVAQPPESAEVMETETLVDSMRAHFMTLFESLRMRAEGTPVSPEFEVTVGHPAEQILFHADALGADHIVIGHRGKSRIERWLMGSISKRIIAYAACNVTVVR